MACVMTEKRSRSISGTAAVETTVITDNVLEFFRMLYRIVKYPHDTNTRKVMRKRSNRKIRSVADMNTKTVLMAPNRGRSLSMNRLLFLPPFFGGSVWISLGDISVGWVMIGRLYAVSDADIVRLVGYLYSFSAYKL